MKVLFLDIDGTLTDEKLNNYFIKHPEDHRAFAFEDKFKTLSIIAKKYDLKVVLSGSLKMNATWWDEDEKGELVLYEHPDLTQLKSLLKKYNIDYLGETPYIPNKGFSQGDKMWKDFDICEYLIEHPEVTDYVILDDAIENDINMLKSHLVKTVWCEDEYGNGGLLPHHIDEIKDKLKPRETYTPEEMEENDLYRQIKYSEFDFVDNGVFGLTKTFYEENTAHDVTIHISLTFDKKIVLFHCADVDEERRGVIHNYKEFHKLMSYFGLAKEEIDVKELIRRP